MRPLPTLLVLHLILSVIAQHNYAQITTPSSEITGNARYAFVIGIDHYNDASIPSLASCRLDAVRFKSHLRTRAGWNVPNNNISLLLDPTKQTIKDQLIKLLKSIKDPSQSSLFVYYSGHGIKGGIVPTDFNNQSPETVLSYGWIKQQLRNFNIGTIIFVVDACYSGSLMTTKSSKTTARDYVTAIKEKDSDLIIFTATNSYRVTPAGRHESMYSKYFLEALENKQTDQNNDRIVSAGELNHAIQQSLGDLFAPQFTGDEQFPFAQLQEELLARRSVNNRLIVENNSSLPQAGMTREKTMVNNTNLIAWRAQLSQNEITKDKAREMINELKTAGDAQSIAKIGFIYREGIGVKKDLNKALAYFINSTEQESGFAIYNLGYFYSHGIGVNQDLGRAFVYYRRAAQIGDPYGQHNLGVMYAKKTGGIVPYDFNKAVYWLEKAATQGNINSLCTLALLFKEKGSWSIKPNQKNEYFEKGFRLLLEAAKTGSARAQFELAHCYEFGIGIKKDTIKAQKWYSLSCQNQELRGCRKVMSIDYANNATSNKN